MSELLSCPFCNRSGRRTSTWKNAPLFGCSNVDCYMYNVTMTMQEWNERPKISNVSVVTVDEAASYIEQFWDIDNVKQCRMQISALAKKYHNGLRIVHSVNDCISPL